MSGERSITLNNHIRDVIAQASSPDYQPIQQYDSSDPDADFFEYWDASKLDRNSRAAILINAGLLRTMRAMPYRGIYGLLEMHINGDDKPKEYTPAVPITLPDITEADYGNSLLWKLSYLHEHLGHTLDYDLGKEAAAMKELPDYHPLHRIYDDLATLTTGFFLFEDTLTPNDGEDEVFPFVRRGVGTAVETAHKTFRLAEGVFSSRYKCNLTSNELAVFGRNSYAVAQKLASPHFDLVDEVQKMVLVRDTGDYHPDRFQVIETPNGEGLDIKEDVWAEIKKKMESGGFESVTTRCPALASRSALTSDELGLDNNPYANVVHGVICLYADALSK